jgi:hypothetical protein
MQWVLTNTAFITSGFWPRVRAGALRAPVFLGSLPRQTGRCAPPAHRSFAAFSSYSKNKIILPDSGRPSVGPFSFNSTTEAREYTECQAFYPVVRIGSPHPLNCKRVWLPTFESKGGDTLTSGWGDGGGGGESIPTMGHTLWYSRPSHSRFADLSGEQ